MKRPLPLFAASLMVSLGLTTSAKATTYLATDAFQYSWDNLSHAESGQFAFGYADQGGAGLTTFNAATSALHPIEMWNNIPGTGPQDSYVPAALYNPTANSVDVSSLTLKAGELALHPGISTDAAVRFTAPSTGGYHIVAAFEASDHSPTGTTVSVFRNANGTPIAGGAVSTYSVTGFSFDEILYLTAGEDIQFNVGNGGNFSNDTTGLSTALSVTSVPLPASVLGGGALLGALALARKLRSR